MNTGAPRIFLFHTNVPQGWSRDRAGTLVPLDTGTTTMYAEELAASNLISTLLCDYDCFIHL
jgi:hypothetical protein